MEKISSEEVKEVLAEVPSVIRELVNENYVLREKVASYDRKAHAERIVDLMDQRSVSTSASTYREKVAELADNPDRDLRVVEEAIRLGAPDIGLAHVSDDEPGGGGDVLTTYLLDG